MHLSKKGLDITASLTLAISAKAKKMKAEGLDVIGFGAGEPDFDTPPYIVEAAKEALKKGFTKYTPASGTQELKQAICNKLEEENNLEYGTDQIIISNGAKHSLYNTFQAILNPGDEVIIPAPYWVSYPELVKLGDGVPVFVETKEEDNFKMKTEELKNAITQETKAIILNSPSNPNGCVYEEYELKKIAQIAVENNLFVVSDEIYEHLIYDGLEHMSIASFGQEIKDLTILINGMSKAFAMTGWRIGYAAAKAEIIKVMSNIQSHATSNPNSIAQYASTVALENLEQAQRIIKSMVKEFSSRREYMEKEINSTNNLSCVLPKGAFYLMVNISEVIGKKYHDQKIEGSLSFADILLDVEKVAVVPGIAFGADNYIRLSYANSLANITKGLERIKAFVNKLSN